MQIDYYFLSFLIISCSCIGWLFTYSTPTLILKSRIKRKFRLPKLIIELIDCLTCSTFWIALFIISIMLNPIIGFLGAAISSFLISFLDGYFKVRL